MEFLPTAIDMVSAAGEYALSRLGAGAKVEYKGFIDPVTEVDKANEAAMVALLQERHPQHAIIGEEGTNIGPRQSRCCWYLDPLDGTVNFAHGLPWISVSAGLLIDGRAEVGAIYVPSTHELFTAVRGQGAFCNDLPIHVSQQTSLHRAVLGTGFPYDVATRVEAVVSLLAAFLPRAQGIRRTGSACLDLCQVACGRYDGFFELGLHVWDVAAGYLLVQEAGGRVSDFGGREGTLIVDQVLVSNGHLHDAMLETVSSQGAPSPLC